MASEMSLYAGSTGRGAAALIDSRRAAAKGNAFTTFGSLYVAAVVGGRPPFSEAIAWFADWPRHSAAEYASAGCFVYEPTPRVMPPSGGRLGALGGGRGGRGPPVFFWGPPSSRAGAGSM